MTTFVALDFENANNDRTSVCAIGVVRVERGAIVARRAELVRPPTTDFRHARTHGITARAVAGAKDFPSVWADLRSLFTGARFIAAHAAHYDRSVLVACAARWSVACPPVPFECTVKLARQTWGLRPTTLPDVARHLGIPLAHHDALSDAEACARIVIAAHAGRGSRSAA